MLSMLISKYCEVYNRDPDCLPELCYEVDGALYAAEVVMDLADPEAYFYAGKINGGNLDSLDNIKQLYTVACKLIYECVSTEELADEIGERGYHSDNVFDTLKEIGFRYHHGGSIYLKSLDELCRLILEVLP